MRERKSGSHLFFSACLALVCEIGAGLREPRLLSKGCSDVWSEERLLLWANKCFIFPSEVEALQRFGWKHLHADCLMPGDEGCYEAEALVSMTRKGIVLSPPPSSLSTLA